LSSPPSRPLSASRAPSGARSSPLTSTTRGEDRERSAPARGQTCQRRNRRLHRKMPSCPKHRTSGRDVRVACRALQHSLSGRFQCSWQAIGAARRIRAGGPRRSAQLHGGCCAKVAALGASAEALVGR
jgi:hypothetical protein